MDNNEDELVVRKETPSTDIIELDVYYDDFHGFYRKEHRGNRIFPIPRPEINWDELRTRYAGMAMQALITRPEVITYNGTTRRSGNGEYKVPSKAAEWAVLYADALIKELKNKK